MLIQKYFETRLELVEAGLKHYLTFDKKYAEELKEAMSYAVFSSGKRWRPLLLISIYEMLQGYQKNKQLSSIIPAACAVEIMHNASIVHDDLPCLMNVKERRTKQSVHKFYDNTTAILAGDALYTLAFEALADIPDKKMGLHATRILAGYTKTYGLIGGQAVDLLNKRKVMKINTLKYIDLKKVGALVQASADIACLLANVDDEVRQAMNTYALNLAISYKMIEDIEEDYNRSGEDFDFTQDYVPSSKSSYTGLMGFDKARKAVDKLIADSEKLIKPFDNNEILHEFLMMIQERLP